MYISIDDIKNYSEMMINSLEARGIGGIEITEDYYVEIFGDRRYDIKSFLENYSEEFPGECFGIGSLCDDAAHLKKLSENPDIEEVPIIFSINEISAYAQIIDYISYHLEKN